jgi:hypothetical protein
MGWDRGEEEGKGRQLDGSTILPVPITMAVLVLVIPIPVPVSSSSCASSPSPVLVACIVPSSSRALSHPPSSSLSRALSHAPSSSSSFPSCPCPHRHVRPPHRPHHCIHHPVFIIPSPFLVLVVPVPSPSSSSCSPPRCPRRRVCPPRCPRHRVCPPHRPRRRICPPQSSSTSPFSILTPCNCKLDPVYSAQYHTTAKVHFSVVITRQLVYFVIVTC